MYQEQITEKPDRHTEGLKLYSTCNKECSGNFMLWREDVSIKICKILFTKPQAEHKYSQRKATLLEKTPSKPRCINGRGETE